MEIRYFECLDSTQKFLINLIKEGKVDKNLAIYTTNQTNGIGSRANSWESQKGDLALSFAIKIDDLPSDLPKQSASIYFGFLMKETLNILGNNCWLKWPNDIYIKNKKCGGVITQIVKDYYVVGIGLNITYRNKGYGFCNEEKDVKKVLNSYFLLLKKREKWQEIFSKFRLEFEKSKGFLTSVNGFKVSIKRAILCDDGALLIDNERIYSLR